MAQYKTIQVTPEEYDMLAELRGYILKNGTNSLENLGDPGIDIKQLYEKVDRNSLAKGAVAGLAIATLLYLLTKK